MQKKKKSRDKESTRWTREKRHLQIRHRHNGLPSAEDIERERENSRGRRGAPWDLRTLLLDLPTLILRLDCRRIIANRLLEILPHATGNKRARASVIQTALVRGFQHPVSRPRLPAFVVSATGRRPPKKGGERPHTRPAVLANTILWATQRADRAHVHTRRGPKREGRIQTRMDASRRRGDLSSNSDQARRPYSKSHTRTATPTRTDTTTDCEESATLRATDSASVRADHGARFAPDSTAGRRTRGDGRETGEGDRDGRETGEGDGGGRQGVERRRIEGGEERERRDVGWDEVAESG
jgi:hypothetical protein